MISLRLHHDSKSETLNSLALAAPQRLNEAFALHENGDSLAAVYLAGYTVEMWLKYAYLRLSGASLGDDVQSRLMPARRYGEICIPGIPDESFHSSLFWFRLIAEKRRNEGISLKQSIELEFMSRILYLHQDWWVGMRYRYFVIKHRKTQEFLDNAGWIQKHVNQLWRD